MHWFWTHIACLCRGGTYQRGHGAKHPVLAYARDSAIQPDEDDPTLPWTIARLISTMEYLPGKAEAQLCSKYDTVDPANGVKTTRRIWPGQK